MRPTTTNPIRDAVVWAGLGLAVAVALCVFGGCSFYPPIEETEFVGRPDGVTECAWLCDQANEWARTCAMPNRQPLDRTACIARLEENQWPTDPAVCEFNAWCYVGYRLTGYCEELVLGNEESGYWQPFVSLPELGCRDQWTVGS